MCARARPLGMMQRARALSSGVRVVVGCRFAGCRVSFFFGCRVSFCRVSFCRVSGVGYRVSFCRLPGVVLSGVGCRFVGFRVSFCCSGCRVCRFVLLSGVGCRCVSLIRPGGGASARAGAERRPEPRKGCPLQHAVVLAPRRRGLQVAAAPLPLLPALLLPGPSVWGFGFGGVVTVCFLLAVRVCVRVFVCVCVRERERVCEVCVSV
jgi:hypothetical protein